mgnify:CR=1 FL=1
MLLAQLWAASVQAADYPERNITVIVPFPAGGASDMTARLVTPKLAERVKQSVIVDNRAGANGSLGATAMKQAPADGYTLLVGSIGVFAINPALYKDLRYDPQKDFDLLSVVVRTPNVLVADPVFPRTMFASLSSISTRIRARPLSHLPVPDRRIISPLRCSGRRRERLVSTSRTGAAARPSMT